MIALSGLMPISGMSDGVRAQVVLVTLVIFALLLGAALGIMAVNRVLGRDMVADVSNREEGG